jgi:hypothetical protein
MVGLVDEAVRAAVARRIRHDAGDADQGVAIHARAVGAAADTERAVDQAQNGRPFAPVLLRRSHAFAPRQSSEASNGNAARIISTASGGSLKRGGLGGIACGDLLAVVVLRIVEVLARCRASGQGQNRSDG